MKGARIILLIGILNACFISLGHYEYIYPVASLVQNDEKYLYLIHQLSSNHIELLLWNPRSKETQKVLLSRFIPAGLQMIPGEQGFSFIDHDTLRVKMHHKRSPQLIDFEEPLYNLTLISWINESTCYFSARNNSMFGIYQASLQGHYDCIIASDDYDCLYPQKVNDLLFYIERDKEFSHKIVCIPYEDLSYHNHLDPARYLHYQRKTEFIKREYTTIPRLTLLNLEKRSIAFLQMINESEGFFIEHPSTIEKTDSTITFFYHYVYRTNSIWNDKILFNFSIPTHYLVYKDSSRLYESMLPLLPRYVPKYGFLYVDAGSSNDKTSLGIYMYDIKTERVVCLNAQENHSLFGILIDDTLMYYGGIVAHEDTLLPRMWLANDGKLCVDLPKQVIK